MREYFGTDGIRGKFGEQLTIDLSLKVAIAASKVLKNNEETKPLVCIARDPRESSKAIENALVAGFSASGVDVELFGTTTTPVISYMIVNNKNKYSAGIMISASHNPYYDNGIKFFGKDGKKLSDKLELEIEQNIGLPNNNTSELGLILVNNGARNEYIKYLKSLSTDLEGLKIGLDTANGSSYKIAAKIFSDLGCEINIIGNEPDGININDNVGSTHPEKLSKLVVDNKLDFGLAFDGDGDRVMLVDHNGEVLDGDYMLYLLGTYLQEQDNLNNNSIVGTVMSNIGFKKALSDSNIKYVETAVGDRYVMQGMNESQSNLGGEQSGHIILSHLLPTGDGILSGLILANIFKQDMSKLHNLKTMVKKYPQVLINIKVKDKKEIMNNVQINDIIKVQSKILGDDGRILVRESGTENLVRVMSEAKTEEQCNEIIKPIIDKINELNKE